jgi:RNA polymerase sigma factor (TIGR02999 family)
MNEVTHILEAAARGEPKAAAELLPLVYNELRRLAASKMSHEPPGQTLQPTALVHEAWLRLAGSDRQTWDNRSHFFAAAAESMRRILIERARQRQALRHGGGQHRIHATDIDLPAPEQDEEALAIHEALDALAGIDAAAADLIKLRYFVGLTMPEAAEAMNIPLRSAERLWAYARAWLRREMSRSGFSHSGAVEPG